MDERREPGPGPGIPRPLAAPTPGPPPAPVGIAVVGCGAWGRNLVRTFSSLDGSRLAAICDTDEARLARISRLFPGAAATPRLAEILGRADVEAVVVSTTSSAHREVAERSLAAGKHVFVEKPLAHTPADAVALVEAARSARRTLMVGHLLLYHPAVVWLRRAIADGTLGDILYMYSVRVNLGTVRQDENALWSFAPHDVSVMNDLVGALPTDVSARGRAFLRKGVEDVVFVNLSYPGGQMGQIQLSWLDPSKTRRTTIVGSRRMAVFDDGEATEKIRVYDRGASVSKDYATYGEYLGLRHGDITIPWIEPGEPLQAEARHFLDCVRTGAAPRTDGAQGVDVVRVLEAASESLRRDGAPVRIAPSAGPSPAPSPEPPPEPETDR